MNAYLPTVLERLGQSQIYCSCPLSRTQFAIYPENLVINYPDLLRYSHRSYLLCATASICSN